MIPIQYRSEKHFVSGNVDSIDAKLVVLKAINITANKTGERIIFMMLSYTGLNIIYR